MPKKNTTRKSSAKREGTKRPLPTKEPDRFTADGRKIVKLEKTRSHQKYILKDGTQVPGASTIAKIGDDQSNLITWAWNLGNAGQDFRKVRDKAADIGTICHFLIECHFHGWVPDLSEYAPEDVVRATIAFGNFKTFWDEQELTVLEPEVQLVSEEHMFGGTIDAPSVDKQGRIVLLDWKTSSGIYLSQKLQLAAYERLWNENRKDQIVQRRAVVRIGKDRADDHSIEWMFSSAPEWEYFKARLDLYSAGLRYKKAA
jgi:hypothetical protein